MKLTVLAPAVLLAALVIADPAAAQLGTSDRGYIGPAFLQIPGVKGDAKDPAHKRWVSVAAHYWKVERAARGRAAARSHCGRDAAPRRDRR